VVAWAGGPDARVLSARAPLERIGQAVGDLAAELALPESLLADNLRGWYHHDWVGDPLARGAYSYVTVGGTRARFGLCEPHGRLVFAGEHVPTPGVTSSTVEAALRSGERAARWILGE
jgi:monoamine oxidase